MKSWPWVRIALASVLLAAIAAGVAFRDQMDPAALEAWITGFGITAPVVFVLVYALASVLFLPGMVMTLAGGETAIQTGLIALALLAAVAFLPRLVKRMRGTTSWLTADNLAAQLAGEDPPLVVDVRNPKEFHGELGHIDGALNLPLDELTSWTAAADKGLVF